MIVSHETQSNAQAKGYSIRTDLNVQEEVTQSNIQTWLREEKKLHITIDVDHFDKWYFIITHLKSKHVCCKSEPIFNTFELALQAALNQSLNLL